MRTNDVVIQNSWGATKTGQVKYILEEEVTQKRYKLSTQQYVHKFLKTLLFKKYILDKYSISFSDLKGDGLDINICHIEGEIPFLLLWKVKQSRHCTTF